jgi:hypothetical protein
MKTRIVLYVFAVLSLLSFNAYAQSTADSVKDLSRKVDALTDELERMQLGEVAGPTESVNGLGPAGSKVYSSKKSGVTIGGYGDLLYNRYASETDDGKVSTQKDRIDMYHLIMYFGYRFNDWILFNSEIEYEHATTQSTFGTIPGYVAVEFAYLDLMFNKNFNLRTGLVLNPMGILNEIHEPPTYLTTIRPRVENNIIPSTWRGVGIGAYGEIIEDLEYRAYFMEGLRAQGFTGSGGIRGGRQHGANALAEDFAFTGKVEYKGINGINIGASFYTGNSGQGLIDTVVNKGEEIGAATTIIEGHVSGAIEGFEFAALYAAGSIDEAGTLSKNLGGQVIGSANSGMYLTLGYDVLRLFLKNSEHQLLPFVHYEMYNTHDEVAEGYTVNKAFERSTVAFGLAYRPMSNVIFKIDYRDNKNAVEAGSTDQDVMNILIGFMF